jgi:two-component system, OmpR family, sensor histidine kinase QseC
MMRALRTRLLVALAAVLFLAWGSWFTVQYFDMSARQGGEMDNMLGSVAEQLLVSLPADIATAGQQQQFTLGQKAVAETGKFAALGFQVWDRATGRRLMSSRRAPAHALVPQFVDGFAETTIAGESWRVFGLSDTQGTVQVQVGLPRAALRAELMRWFTASLALALLLMLGIGVAIWLVIHWSLRPVLRVSASLAARPPLDLAPLPERGMPTEVMPLLRGFNQLMARLAQALHRERQFLGEAAHELRTPLAALLAQAQVLQHAGSDAEARAALARLVAGIERTSRLAQQLLDAARVESGGSMARATDVDLSMIAGMVADEFELIAQRAGQTIELDGGFAPVHGDLDDLGIVVRNLLDNALRHGGTGTRVRLVTRVTREGQAMLSVADDGPGIADADRERVFEKFYRAGGGQRAAGIGMGLSLVERVVTAHGGQLRCGAGLDGRGFSVEILLPTARR